MSSAAKGVKNPDSTQEFEPIVKLEEVNVAKLKEKEEELYKQRCLIYLFCKKKQNWITRGKGNVKMLKKDISPFIVMVHNEEKTFKLRLSTVIHPNSKMVPNDGSDRAWTFSCEDYSINTPDENGVVKPEVAQFGIKFKTPEIAEEFKKKYDECQALNVKTAEALKAKASGDKKDTPKPKEEEAPEKEAPKEDTPKA